MREKTVAKVVQDQMLYVRHFRILPYAIVYYSML